ncbi:MAG: hypothetical protein AAGM22_03045 [Acidobacteriota bacterium]
MTCYHEELTVDFTPPGDHSQAGVTFWKDGSRWKRGSLPNGDSVRVTLSPGQTHGWNLWGISFWGEGNNPDGESRILRTRVAKMVASQCSSETAYFEVGGERYAYVSGISKINQSGAWTFEFTVNNDNKAAQSDQIGWVCFEVIFADSSWRHYYVSRDPEIKLEKEGTGPGPQDPSLGSSAV